MTDAAAELVQVFGSDTCLFHLLEAVRVQNFKELSVIELFPCC